MLGSVVNGIYLDSVGIDVEIVPGRQLPDSDGGGAYVLVALGDEAP
jgi:hypothetical protein